MTWNVAGRVARQAEQAQAVAAIGADVVALLAKVRTHEAVAAYLAGRTPGPRILCEHSALVVDLERP